MTSSISLDSTVLARLQSMAKTAAARFDGLEADDFLSEAWLAYNHAKEQGKSDTLAFSRAEYAMKDAMQAWISVGVGSVIVDGDEVQYTMNVIPDRVTKTLRTRLPRQLKRALQSFSERDRKILYLAYMWNRTGAEIAEQLGIPEGTVASIKHRCLNKLKTDLGIIAPIEREEKPRPVGKPLKSPHQLIAADGTIYTVTENFKAFCEAHGLDYKATREVVNPKASQKAHKGWKLLTS